MKSHVNSPVVWITKVEEDESFKKPLFVWGCTIKCSHLLGRVLHSMFQLLTSARRVARHEGFFCAYWERRMSFDYCLSSAYCSDYVYALRKYIHTWASAHMYYKFTREIYNSAPRQKSFSKGIFEQQSNKIHHIFLGGILLCQLGHTWRLLYSLV